MKDLCYSVRLQSLTPSRSGKAFLAEDFNGNSDWIPSQFVYEQDWDVTKSEAWWISAWILDKKNITYKGKKEAWFHRKTRRRLPTYEFTKHTPKKVENKNVKPDKNLVR